MWQFQDLTVPMMEDENGTLFTTGAILASVLGVTDNNLVALYQAHKDEFDDVRVNTTHANDFLQANKETFGVQRVRQDMHLWSEDDMILFAGLSRTPVGKAFRKEMIKAIKAQARKGFITEEYFDSVVSQLVTRLTALEEQKQQAASGLNTAASAAGSALAAQRYTKPFRS
jgi:prophage antirepressor-like protein